MQVRVSEHGQLIIPAPIREQLGIGPGTLLEVEVDHGSLRASVVSPGTDDQSASEATPPVSRLALLKPHPEVMDGPDEDLDQVKVWDEAEWAKEWDA